ncbi:DnaJ family domain-containing protein [Nocardiopsis chromatogenes]|uniref:DnaJ family domain-containing protein n=1 Tax=Nocardiopsis chromatogenes TaxID=280239 RepID=UPI00034D8AED|nr:DUF1992 domain-containing protein [Nocardiopsis chromatogenes]
MSKRKPAGMEWESWADQQVREAMERGEFDGLPGAGKPIPDIDRPRDDLWWVRRKTEEEGVAPLPPALRVRKEAEEARAAAVGARTEDDARRIIAEINEEIVRTVKFHTTGPPLNMMPFDVEEVVAEWRERKAADMRKAEERRAERAREAQMAAEEKRKRRWWNIFG